MCSGRYAVSGVRSVRLWLLYSIRKCVEQGNRPVAHLRLQTLPETEGADHDGERLLGFLSVHNRKPTQLASDRFRNGKNNEQRFLPVSFVDDRQSSEAFHAAFWRSELLRCGNAANLQSSFFTSMTHRSSQADGNTVRKGIHLRTSRIWGRTRFPHVLRQPVHHGE